MKGLTKTEMNYLNTLKLVASVYTKVEAMGVDMSGVKVTLNNAKTGKELDRVLAQLVRMEEGALWLKAMS
jgi:hypothetical protein